MFAPKIHIRNTSNESIEVYRMMVYYSNKTMIVLLFNHDYNFSYQFLDSVNYFLGRNVPAVASQLDAVISKVLGKEDPIRFFYFNQMNLALKFSNLITKDVFNLDLILLLN